MTKWLIIGGIILIIGVPFYVFIVSRVQMAGWLSVLKQWLTEEKRSGTNADEDEERKQVQGQGQGKRP